MWVMTTAGFVSAVEDRNNPEGVVVRARDRQSLETMLAGIELVGNAADEPIEIPDIISVPGDYRWRVFLSKATFAIWLQHEVLSYLTYDNFKNALTETRGETWHQAAMKVWVAMLAVDDGPKEETGPRDHAWGLQEDWTLDGDEEDYEAIMQELPNE